MKRTLSGTVAIALGAALWLALTVAAVQAEPVTPVRRDLFTIRPGVESVQPGATNLSHAPGIRYTAAFTMYLRRSASYMLMGQVRHNSHNTAADYGPAWSPDGTSIAFFSDRDGQEEIYVMDADGSNQTRLTFTTEDETTPVWSPDGTRLAFSRGLYGLADIYVMDADGSNQARLTGGAGANYNPAWSPDCGRLAFNSDRDGNLDIYRMSIDGSNQIRFTDKPADDWAPDW